MNKCEIVAKSPEEAIEQALAQLNTTIDDVEIEIFEEAPKGLLGFLKSKEVRVIVTKKVSIEQIAVNFLDSILQKMNIKADYQTEMAENEIKINISGENMGVVIGRRGQTLDALQYLVSLVVNRRVEDYIRVVLNTENYREKREKSLVKLANKLANRARKYRKDIALEPMNPYERRIIHSSLQNNKYVSTRSEGQDPNRKVIIFLNK